jgi:hypothetical protein
MNAFSSLFLSKNGSKTFRLAFLLLLFLIPLSFFSACKKQVDYFSYVSELRSNIFIAQEDELSLRIFSVQKESPYEADGIKMEIFERTEFYVTAPSGDKEYTLSFCVDDQEINAVMSFDNVKCEYYYFCNLDISSLSSLDCTISCQKKTQTFCAKSIKTSSTLAPTSILNIVKESEQELFTSLTDKYGFAGEIYLRLIYEDAPYYYVGIIDRNGKVNAFLLNGETGKILAKRTI